MRRYELRNREAPVYTTLDRDGQPLSVKVSGGGHEATYVKEADVDLKLTRRSGLWSSLNAPRPPYVRKPLPLPDLCVGVQVRAVGRLYGGAAVSPRLASMVLGFREPCEEGGWWSGSG